MTPTEFKEKYPQYRHLQGDELWDVMTKMVPKLEGWKNLTADPNRKIEYLPPIELANGYTVQIEDDSKTVWIDENGNKGCIVEKQKTQQLYPTESYKFEIWDASK